MKSTAQIRREFLEFFSERGHRVVRSSPLVPANDPTLLFTNAGMVQFKDVFLGAEKREYSRAATAQRCVRAGGKHNDLENVGYTARHHTFFEMLGNFSFGDYFKREAIEFAWEFLTKTCGFAPERLWVTVYEEDDDAARIWVDEIGVDPARLSRIGDKPGKRHESDNFWAMGDTGPCGPCTEIFYDHGPEVPGGPPGTPEEDGDRYIEIWNLVFMQFDRGADGEMRPLPKPCVDTGMGLERLAAVLQGVHSNYEIDLFQHLIKAAAEKTGCDDLSHPSLKVIADHIRACAFLIADGVLPANDGRGYVLRRIIRRAIRHGYKLGQKQPFFAAMVEPLVEVMGEAYPELVESKEVIERVVRQEEEQFFRTLANGMSLADHWINKSYALLGFIKQNRGWSAPAIIDRPDLSLDIVDNDKPLAATVGVKAIWEGDENPVAIIQRSINGLRNHNETRSGSCKWQELIIAMIGDFNLETEAEIQKLASTAEGIRVSVLKISDEALLKIPGKLAFTLYDTYGFPFDLTADICRERGFKLDKSGFEREMQAQRERARAAGQFCARDGVAADAVADLSATEFLGYGTDRVDDAEVVAILVDGAPRERLVSGERALVILDRTPFYAESGGQVGDTGRLTFGGARFEVEDTRKLAGVYHVHDGELAEGGLAVGDKVSAEIDAGRRAAVVRHHSATHLMHAALREVLGEHVQQKGSLVAPDRLRFDFSHFEPVKPEQIEEIERRVNGWVQQNADAQADVMDYDDAIQAGALAFFGDKYGDQVRVLRFGGYSTELCGGTHVDRVGDIGPFKIIAETGISAGVRRIEAVAGDAAVRRMQDTDRTLRGIAEQLKASPEQAADRVAQVLERSRALEKELERLKQKLASARSADLGSESREINGIRVLAAKLDGVDPNSLRDTVDQLKSRLGSAVIVLGTAAGTGVRLVAGVTPDLTDRVKAGELVNHVAGQVGGKGGGRPDFAQAGGSQPKKLGEAIESVYDWVGTKTS